MWIVIGIILGLIGLDLAAALWSIDSREGGQNPEWARLDLVGPSLFSGKAPDD
jgi:hypothetical protein